MVPELSGLVYSNTGSGKNMVSELIGLVYSGTGSDRTWLQNSVD